jgi:hypothetical protein
MSPTIRIDDDVFEELKKHAEPLVDTPNSVLRRLLRLGEGLGHRLESVETKGGPASVRTRPSKAPRHRKRRRSARRQARAKSGTLLHESAYELPMLEIISEHGGRAAAREVLDELGTRLDGQLTEVDRQTLGSGDVRWRNRAQFVRLRLVEQGDMVRNSPRGIWEITEQGRRRLVADAA